MIDGQIEVKIMSIEQRILKLEDLVGITDEIPPLVVITVKNCEKNSTDPGVPAIGIIPAPACGTPGASLTRNEDETPDDFLERCNVKYAEIYE
jgi:hypothetical protein